MSEIINFVENHPFWTTLWLFLICDAVSHLGVRIYKEIKNENH